MSGYLVDTNVPSELTRDSPDGRVAGFLEAAGSENVSLSVLTVGEICKGIEGLPSGPKRTDLQRWLDRDVRSWFSGRILPVTESIAERWGRLAAVRKRTGATLSVIDGLIAATALEHELIVVTRNVRDFSGLGLNLLNPWDRKLD